MSRWRLRRPRRAQVAYAIALAVTWVLLWGDLSVGNMLAGLAIASVLVVALPMPTIPFSGTIRPIGLLRLVGHFLYDVVVASFQVAWQVFRFGRQPRSVIVSLNMRSDSDLYLTITAEMISLVPGTLSIDLRRPESTLLVHLFAVKDDLDKRIDSIRAQEDRVLAAFASDEELERAYPFGSGVGGRA